MGKYCRFMFTTGDRSAAIFSTTNVRPGEIMLLNRCAKIAIDFFGNLNGNSGPYDSESPPLNLGSLVVGLIYEGLVRFAVISRFRGELHEISWLAESLRGICR